MLGIAQRVFQSKHRAPGVSQQNNFVEPKVLPDFVEIIEIGGERDVLGLDVIGGASASALVVVDEAVVVGEPV